MAGLLITYVALNLMDGHGQPALLYIVPFTLGNFVTASGVNHVGLQSGLESVWLCDFKQNREKCIIWEFILKKLQFEKCFQIIGK
jgi:hypothetical protein